MGDLHESETCHGSIARVSMYITKNPELLSRVPACSESSVENVKTLMFARSDLWSRLLYYLLEPRLQPSQQFHYTIDTIVSMIMRTQIY